MDDISEKLAGILNDPDSMERVKRMAESLLGEQGKEEEKPSLPMLSGEGMPSADEMHRIMQIVSALKSKGNDSRTRLLLALRENLSPPRKEKVDTAVKILRLIDMLPLLKESGIFNL
ncbi:MAG: hypothetical protein IJZ75_04720 [Clostridia bacterium]|nr:hypothetical protein [Clostridia bacterium]